MDTNQAITLLVASTSAIVAAVALVYAGWQSKTAHDALEHNRNVFKRNLEPYIFADIRSDPHQPQMVIILIKNTGPTVGTKIKVSFEPPLQTCRSDEVKTFQAILIPSLPPDAKLTYALGPGGDFFKANDSTCTIAVTASSSDGPIDELAYNVDLHALGQTLAAHKTLDHVVEYLKKISDAMSK